MAWEGPQPVKLPGIVAGADLSALQYTFVALNASGAAITPGSQGVTCVGVLQNKPTSGQACEIVAVGISKAVADSAIDEGVALTTASDGKADVAEAADFALGSAVTAATAQGQIITILVNCAAPVVI